MSQRRQALETAPEIVCKVAERAAGERQVARSRRVNVQMTAQQRERVFARQLDGIAADFGQLAVRHQRRVRFGRDDVETRLREMMAAAVEKHRPWQVGDGLEQRRAVGAIRQFSAQQHRSLILPEANSSRQRVD